MKAVAIAMRNAQRAGSSDATFREPDKQNVARRRRSTLLIVAADPDVGAAVCTVARSARFDAVVTDAGGASFPGALASGPELLVIERAVLAELPATPLSSKGPVPVILLSAEAGPPPSETGLGPVMAVVAFPWSARNLLPAIEMASARYREIRALQTDLAALARKLSDRSSIDRAKALLLEHHGLSEPEAYRWLQRTAMNHRTSLSAIAVRVVDELEVVRVHGQRPA